MHGVGREDGGPELLKTPCMILPNLLPRAVLS